MWYDQIRYTAQYETVEHFRNKYPVKALCGIVGISRASYYKWRNRGQTSREETNRNIAETIKKEYEERRGIVGYRQMKIILEREHRIKVSENKVYRLMNKLELKSVCRKKKRTYARRYPEVLAENILDREFMAEDTCEKWLTDVTEMKYGDNGKAYLSAILDLGDRSIVAYDIGHRNNNKLVFDTFDKAREVYPEAQPLFHSDRGFQYTSRNFREKLDKAEMTQSMSRVAKCIDNGPMEGFWGILKAEMYNLRKFDDYPSLKQAIDEYMEYYNNRRYQKRLRKMTPIEYREHLLERHRMEEKCQPECLPDGGGERGWCLPNGGSQEVEVSTK